MSDRLLPDWIQAYMAYTAESRSPDEYHLWVALATISGAIRRKAFFNFDYFLLYPNLYTVLVGPPGRCKKSTAMRIGRRLLAEIPGVSFSTDSTSRERLIQDLTTSFADGHSSMTAYSSEFASLLTTSGMDMVVFLTDIYDCPDEWSHKTKTGGSNKIRAPYLNLIGGTTPDWIARSLPLDTVGIGLTARIVFVYSDTPRIRKAFPKLSAEQIALKQILVKDLTKISLISGEYKMTLEAEQWYEAWDDKNQRERAINDPRLSGYYERKPMHLVKVAMLVSASHKDETNLEVEDLEKALQLLDHIEPAMARTFSAVGKNPLALDLEQVTMAVLAKPDIQYSELMQMFKHSVRTDEMDEVLKMLQITGIIKLTQKGDGPHYSPGDNAK